MKCGVRTVELAEFRQSEALFLGSLYDVSVSVGYVASIQIAGFGFLKQKRKKHNSVIKSKKQLKCNHLYFSSDALASKCVVLSRTSKLTKSQLLNVLTTRSFSHPGHKSAVLLFFGNTPRHA